MDNKKIDEAIFLSTIAMKAMEVPEEDILVSDLPLTQNMLLHEDTLVPVIIGLSNIMGNNILGLDQYYNCVYPIEFEKTENSLCYAKVIESDCEHFAPRSIRMLLTMEVIDSLFVPRLDNKIDLTHVVKNWREVLSDLKEGEKIDLQLFHKDLFIENMNRLTLKNRLNINN